MTRRLAATTSALRDERGFALLGSMMILVILMGVGLALVARSDTQSNVSGQERVKESGFNLSEAALNAQALQLGRTWPSADVADCDASTGAQSWCPLAAAIGNGYTTQDYAASCPSKGNTAALWKTQIRDNVSTTPQYWTTAVNSRPHWDANGDGSVWVRAFSTVQCQAGSVVGLVAKTSQPITIANTVLTANYMTTTNQGKKVIIDTLGAYAQPVSIQPGPAAQPSKIVLRCAPGAPSPCANYNSSKGQIQPPTVTTSSTTSSQALTATQLQQLETQAAAAGTLHTGTDCPTSLSTLSSPANGAPVVIQGPCNISITGNGSINSGTTPGVLVIENGTLTLGGSVTFYGLLYMVNKQASSGIVVSIQGNAVIQGSVNIDGNGGISAGSSKTNLIFDSRASGLLKGSSGAALNRGTMRTLPPSTP
jgi:Tfp pilus assembly protein PilX